MKKFTKRTLALLLALVVCLSMVACGSAPAESNDAPNAAPAANGSAESDYIKVVIAGASDPGNYLPFNADNSVRNTYSRYFYEQLFAVHNSSDGLVPLLATGYERTEEGVYRVTIHEDIYDYAGEHITANDVAFCINKIVENGERANSMGEVQRCEVVDDYTVDIIILPDTLGTFERCVTVCDIVSQKTYEASKTGFSADPIGTGPYYISEWLPGASITFKKNENYWAKDKDFNNQNCDEIEVKFIAEPSQVAIELETGGVDFAYNVSTKDSDAFVGRDGFGIVDSPYVQVRSICFNCSEQSVFNDIRLRQAVCYAVDPAAILQAVYDGKGGIATCLAVPEPEAGFVLDFVQDWKNQMPYEYNVEKAKELMAEAGYPNGGLKVRLMAKDMDEYRSTCEIIQAYLAQIGIEVEILCYENALYQTYRLDPTAFDMNLCQVANNGGAYLPMGWKWYMNISPSTGVNVMMQNDPKLQELLDAALGLDTHNEASVAALHEYVMESATLYPCNYTLNNFVYVDSIVEPFISQGAIFYPNMSTFNNHARNG